MDWLLLATGVTGGITLDFVVRWLFRRIVTPPSVMSHFSPKGGCTDAIVHELKRARREVLVLAYSFSSKPIAQALIDAKTRGVKVELLLDKSNEQEAYSDLAFFIEQGLAPLIDSHHAIAHNKVIVIDRRTLLTGSFNFTHQAEAENAENLLIIKGHPELVSMYRTDFETHKSHSAPPKVKPGAQAHSHHQQGAPRKAA
jgi:phosphatidylserine/phosphatidylglycerophosphate/cardiolipin synthase-like enzyme